MKQKRFKVKLTLLEPLLGTVPKNRDVYASYIETKRPKPNDGEPEAETVEETEEKGWTGFHQENGTPFMYDYQIKGFIKEAGNILKKSLKINALKSKLNNFLFVFPRKIPLPQIDTVPLERPLRAQTAQGPRVTVTRSDQVPAVAGQGAAKHCEGSKR